MRLKETLRKRSMSLQHSGCQPHRKPFRIIFLDDPRLPIGAQKSGSRYADCSGSANVSLFDGFSGNLFDYKRIMVNNPTRRTLCILTGRRTFDPNPKNPLASQHRLWSLRKGDNFMMP